MQSKVSASSIIVNPLVFPTFNYFNLFLRDCKRNLKCPFIYIEWHYGMPVHKGIPLKTLSINYESDISMHVYNFVMRLSY